MCITGKYCVNDDRRRTGTAGLSHEIYICIHIYIDIYIHIHTYTGVHVYTYMHTCIYTYVHYRQILRQRRSAAHRHCGLESCDIYLYTYIYICVYIYIHIRAYTYTHICIHAFIHMCITGKYCVNDDRRRTGAVGSSQGRAMVHMPNSHGLAQAQANSYHSQEFSKVCRSVCMCVCVCACVCLCAQSQELPQPRIL